MQPTRSLHTKKNNAEVELLKGSNTLELQSKCGTCLQKDNEEASHIELEKFPKVLSQSTCLSPGVDAERSTRIRKPSESEFGDTLEECYPILRRQNNAGHVSVNPTMPVERIFSNSSHSASRFRNRSSLACKGKRERSESPSIPTYRIKNEIGESPIRSIHKRGATAKKSTRKDTELSEIWNQELYNLFEEVIQEYNDTSSESPSSPTNLSEVWKDGRAKSQCVSFPGGLFIPPGVWTLLYPYQRVAVQWLWELHSLNTGGILADEMGLGKTVITAGFLGSLGHSQLMAEYVLLACPATIMSQWMQEMSYWAPHLRVRLLHRTSEVGADGKLGTFIESLRSQSSRNTILLTTYATLRLYLPQLLKLPIGYVILDEGHFIRNAESATAKAVKSFRTPHRILLTGTPIQNKISELWSLFNFVNPLLLGDLDTFVNQFEEPIRQGSYKGATDRDVHSSLAFSKQLKARIGPFLLRRLKNDVGIQLTAKSEKLIYVKLTPAQVRLYSGFLMSENMSWRLYQRAVNKEIDRHSNCLGNDTSHLLLFQAISYLRNLCNHPWLCDRGNGITARQRKRFLTCPITDISKPVNSKLYDDCVASSCKLRVLLPLLAGWNLRSGQTNELSTFLKEEGTTNTKSENDSALTSVEKTLIYTQTRMMLDIIEQCIRYEGYDYIRMDGLTPIAHRGTLIDSLNNDPSITIGLLTTRVGGLGINFTGCSRVVIIDPDWNPHIDIQARERVWRLGQKKDVEIYRLLAAGTIEEKVYERQIMKLCSTETVLKSTRVNKASSNLSDVGVQSHTTGIHRQQLSDYFTLGSDYDETLDILRKGRFGSQNFENFKMSHAEETSRCDTIDSCSESLKGNDELHNISSQRGGIVSVRDVTPLAADNHKSNASDLELLRQLLDARDIKSVTCHDQLLQKNFESLPSESYVRSDGRQSRIHEPASRIAHKQAQSAVRALGHINRPRRIDPVLPSE